jgi:pre-rRNA-processing protein IPI1
MSPKVRSTIQPHFYVTAADSDCQSKALVLASLAKFLRVSLAPDGYDSAEQQEERARPALPLWFLSGSFATSRDYSNYISQSTSHTESAHYSSLVDLNAVDYDEEGIILSLDDSTLASRSLASLSAISELSAELFRDGNPANQNKEALPRSAEALLLTLLPILVSAFLDTAPTAFSPSAPASSVNTPDVALDTVLAVAGIARDLWRAIVMSQNTGEKATEKIVDIAKGLAKLVGHMGAYFPFGTGVSGKRTSEVSSPPQIDKVSLTSMTG